jgi:hypothetical protein
MKVVVCSVDRTRVSRILEASAVDASVASRCAVEKAAGISLVVFARRIVRCCGSDLFG